MNAQVKLYNSAYHERKTYLFAGLFIVGNVLLPQLCHLLKGAGPMFLPIFFFTLIAAYKYGWVTGLCTAILSPVVNSLFFGMPPVSVLPIIMVKSVILAGAAAWAAHYFGKINLLILLAVVLSYRIVGGVIEYFILQDFQQVIQIFIAGIPGMLIQIVGGYFLLRFIADK